MNADAAWRARMRDTIERGEKVSPRGQACLELRHAAVRVDIERSLVLYPERRLSYKFAAAEALWILDGSNRLERLTPYAARMRDFSDDGLTLAGAYGPRLMPQLDWAVGKLCEDRDTRQSVASVWTPSPAPSRDIPCTIALTFMIRGGLLHCHAFMRSSDLWLGLPYDLFSFSQVALVALARYNARRPREAAAAAPGELSLTASSSHIYERDVPGANEVLAAAPPGGIGLGRLPAGFTEADVRERLGTLQGMGKEALL